MLLLSFYICTHDTRLIIVTYPCFFIYIYINCDIWCVKWNGWKFFFSKNQHYSVYFWMLLWVNRILIQLALISLFILIKKKKTKTKPKPSFTTKPNKQCVAHKGWKWCVNCWFHDSLACIVINQDHLTTWSVCVK